MITIKSKTPTNGRCMSNTAKLFPNFWLIIVIGLRPFRFMLLLGLLHIIPLLNFLLVKSTMSTSPSISSVSYRKASGEHLKTRILIFRFITSAFSLSKIEKYEVDIPKTVLIFLPVVFSKVKRSDASRRLVDGWPFSFDQLSRRFPEENWSKLFSSSYNACKLAAKDDEPTIPDTCVEIGTTSRGSSLHTMSKRLKGLFKRSKS